MRSRVPFRRLLSSRGTAVSFLVVLPLALEAQIPDHVTFELPGTWTELHRLYITAVDVDGDGDTDLVSSNLEDERGRIYLSDGLGGFVGSGGFWLGFGARRAVPGDLDGDGSVDFACPDLNNTNDLTFSVAYGDGAGRISSTAQPRVRVRPRGLALGDLDGDGKDEVVIASNNPEAPRVEVIRSVARNSFQAESLWTVPIDEPTAAAIGDVSGDGILDFALWGRSLLPPHAVIYERDGLGGYREVPVDTEILDPGGDLELEALTADFDGDGRDELYLLGHVGQSDAPASRAFRVARAEDGSYEAFGLAPSLDATWIGVSDVNADGEPDVLASQSRGDDSRVAMYASRGDGSLTVHGPCVLPLPCSSELNLPLAGDYDANGALDLAIHCEGEELMHVFLSLEGCVTPGDRRETDVSVAGLPIERLTTGNFLDDGRPEIVVGGGGEARMLAVGEIGLVEISRFATPPTVGGAGAGDFDGDGWDELVLSDVGSETVVIYSLKTGGLESVVALAAGAEPSGLLVEDLDGDGDEDLAVVSAKDGVLRIFLGAGDRTFSDPLVTEVGATPRSVTSGDVNGDGLNDVVVTGAAGNKAMLLLGLGNSTWLLPVPIRVLDAPIATRVRDLNGDGLGDLVVIGQEDDGVLVLENRGGFFGGRFYPLPRGATPRALEIADTDDDGIEDLLVATPGVRAVSVLKGEGTSRFTTGEDLRLGVASSLLAGPHPDLSLVISDADGDGTTDVVVGDAGRERVLVVGAASRRPLAPDETFRRGDVDADGKIRLTDAVRILMFLFAGGSHLPCADAADADDDGAVHLSDAVDLLQYQFGRGRPPAAPGPLDCGSDPTADHLGCRQRCDG